MADIDVLGIKFELRGMEDGIRNLEKMDKVTDEVQATLKQLKKSLEEIGKASGESYKDQVAAVQKLAAAKKQLEDASKKQAEAEVARAKARKIEASIDEKALDGKVRRENAYATQLDNSEKRQQSLINLRKKEQLIDEDVSKKQIANATALIKQRALESSITEKALDAKIRRENTYIKSVDQAAQREQVLQKQKAQTAAAEELANERRQKAAHWEQKRLDTSSLLAAQESRLTNQNLVALERLNTYKLNQMSMIETRQLKANASIEQGAARLALQQEKFEYQKQRAAERAANGSVSAWQKFKDTMSTISDVTIGGFGIGMVVDKLSGVVKAADEMVLLDSRLKLATKSSADFAEAQSRLRQSAVDTGLSLNAQIANYTQIERSTRAMGLSVQQLSFLTESFGKAAVVSGADAESFKSAITQLNQGFASGVVRGQEFNSVAEQAPAILEALANGLRGNNKQFDEFEKKGLLGVAALRKMAGEGKLVNSVTIPALMKGLQDTNKQFEQMPLTVERAFGMLSNKYKIWISDQNSATKSTNMLAESIKGLAENFSGIMSGLATGATVLATIFGAKLLGSFVEARVKGVQSFIEIRQANIQAAAAADIWANTTARGVEVARKQLDIAQKTQGSTKAVEAATLNLVAAEAKHNSALEQKAKTLDTVSVKTSLAANAAKGFGAVVGALGGPIGVALTALGFIIQYWDDITKAILGATKAHEDFMKAQGMVSTSNTGVEISDALSKQQKHTAELRKQADELKRAQGVTPRGEFSQSKYDRDTVSLAKLNEQIRESVLQEQKLENTRKQRNAIVTQQAQDGLKPLEIKDAVDTSKPKKTPLPDETLGSDAALRNLERSLSLRQSAVEKEKQLLGYSSEENLAQLASMESRKLSLQWQQEEQKLSEESKKKMTAEARKQHNEVVAGFQAEKKIQLESLLVMQERRRLDNEEAKAKLTINSLNENAINAAKAEYAVAKEKTNLDLSALDMAERMGDVAGSVAAERKKELEISLQLTKNQVDMTKALAEEKVAQEAYNRAQANAAVYGKEEVERRRQALLSAEDTVEAVKQENIALKEQLELEKKLSILRTDGLSGAKKAISDYIDGLDNWYQTGYNIANESINLLEDTFTSFIETGKLSGAKLFKYLRDEFKKLAVQRIIIQPIMSGASNILSSLGSAFSGNFSGIASLANVASGLSGVGSMIGGGLSGAAFNGASAFATSSVGQWLGLSETTAEIGTIMTEAGTTLANAADLASQYGGYAKAAYDVFNAFKEGKGWGAAAGSAIGSYWGAPGAFLGNTLGGFVDKAFSGGGGQKVGGEGAVGMSNLGLFPEGQTDALVQDALVSYQTSLKDVAKKFGVSLENMSVAYGYETDPQGDAGNFFSSKAYLNGASIREVMVQKYEGEVVDQMAKEFKTITVLALSGAGLKEDFQAAFKDFDVKNVTEESVNKVLARLDQITVVLDTFKAFAGVFPNLTSLSIDAKESLISLAGGLENFSNNLKSYYENYFSEQERISFIVKELTTAFDGLGVKMPQTKEAFRSLVEAQDLNTQAGREMYNSLINLSGAFSEVNAALQNLVTSALSSVESAINAEKSTAKSDYDTAVGKIDADLKTKIDELQKAYDSQVGALDAQKTSLEAASKAASDYADKAKQGLQDLFDALNNGVESLNKTVTIFEKKTAISNIASITASVQGGASVTQYADQIKALIPVLTQDNQDLYSSFEEWSIDQARANANLVTLRDKTGVTLSVAEQQLAATTSGFDNQLKAIEDTKTSLKAALDEQIATLEKEAEDQKGVLKTQYDALIAQLDQDLKFYTALVESSLNMNLSILSVKDAVTGLSAALATYNQQNNSTVTQTTSNGSGLSVVNDIKAAYNSILGREADLGGLAWYVSQYGAGKSLDKIKEEIAGSPEAKAKIDGSHADGLLYVPFDGYEARLHKGERVLTKSEAEQYAKGDEEIRSLLRELIEICKSTTRNTFYIEKKLDNWDGNGLPATRTT